jgi:SAM-dependent methyltransferase
MASLSSSEPPYASPQSPSVPENHFGEEVAARYDASAEHDPMFAAEAINPVVDLLAERGVPVHGIDLSEAMVARLRAKPGADKIDVTMGDFATTRVGGTFRVAYVVYNTIQNLTTQDAQVACFQNVAAHLEPGGCFVIEVGLPDLQRLPFGETIRPFHLSDSRLGFDTFDVANQGLVSHHYTRDADGRFAYSSGPFRYVWPSELDLMARIAGLTPRERWSGWKREPFTSVSEKLVGVWEKPAS